MIIDVRADLLRRELAEQQEMLASGSARASCIPPGSSPQLWGQSSRRSMSCRRSSARWRPGNDRRRTGHVGGATWYLGRCRRRPNKFSFGTLGLQEETPHPEGFQIFPFNPQPRYGRFSRAHPPETFFEICGRFFYAPALRL